MPALSVTGTVHFVLAEAKMYQVDLNAGTSSPPRLNASRMPRAAVLRVSAGGEGSALVTLTAERKPFHYEQDFLELGISAGSCDVLVVKIGYLVPDLERLAAVNLMALSPGAVYADVARMPYTRLEGPIYPKDLEMVWAPVLA